MNMRARAVDTPINNKNNRLPNFLIVGAAKSATSSLHYYLNQHPQISMASLKETWFFSFYKKPPNYSSPGTLGNLISELDEYLTLFDGADASQILGDACPSYLYTYEDTIKNIRELYSAEALADLKIIISLREPVSRAYSQYYTFKRRVYEPLKFEEAIKESTISKRIQNNWNIFYDYLGFGMYSRQVEAFQNAFGKDRVHVVLFDDIHADIQKACVDIYKFLGVDPDFVVNARLKHNSVSGEPRVKWVVAALFSKNRIKRMVSALLPRLLRTIIINIIVIPLLKRDAMDVETRDQLAEYFHQDILELEQLIGRDLGNWRFRK